MGSDDGSISNVDDVDIAPELIEALRAIIDVIHGPLKDAVPVIEKAQAVLEKATTGGSHV